MRMATVDRRIVIALFLAIAAATWVVSLSDAHAQETFGISSFSSSTSTSQAGAHADFTTSFALNTDAAGNPVDQVKDVQFKLPVGIAGNPQAIPRCTPYEFSTFSCLPSTQVGVLVPTFVLPGSGPVSGSIPVFNLTPSPGHAATFGVSLLIVTILIQVDVSKDGTGALTATLSDLSTLLSLQASTLTLWGVPADPSHEALRSNQLGSSGPQPAGVAPAAFMTNPTDCSDGPLTSVVRADSWQNPGQFVTRATTQSEPTGCERLQMSPTISVTPDTTQVDTPAGYTIEVANPLNEEPYSLATPDLRSVSVTLPLGASLSPSAANGLAACSDAQFVAENCPSAAKIGTASVASPIAHTQLNGWVYLGAPTPSETYRIFLTASGSNVTIDLTGHLQPNPATGQLTATFDQNPQLPLSDLQLSFYGGPLAVLANPAMCGPATTTSQIASYAGQIASLSSTFVVDADGRGGACPTMPPFSPSFSAGTTLPLAGGFSPFVITISRDDAQQELSVIAAQLPAGLSAMLSRAVPCTEPAAERAMCPVASQIGTVTVAAGAGSEPLYTNGSVYLTGPDKGAPFGLLLVVPANAGPFSFGPIIVRATVQVSPTDLHLTIASDPMPSVLNGIPLRLRLVNITLNRTGFIINPTDCAPQTLSGMIGSTQGTNALVSTPFEVNGCAGLSLASKLTASTRARASSGGDGASLDVSVINPLGASANIRSVTLYLPARLRPRLSTIQHACPGASFAADPRTCPASSLVGSVMVSTPVLASPLSGPIYLVARGGVQYPHLVMVPQGDGIRAELDGTLNISSDGVIRAAFRTLPDVPINSLHLSLPRGPHSMLGATASLCSKRLGVPYALTGQNGAQIRRTTIVAVKGCPKHRATKAGAA
jgi:hypothetical protein